MANYFSGIIKFIGPYGQELNIGSEFLVGNTVYQVSSILFDKIEFITKEIRTKREIYGSN